MNAAILVRDGCGDRLSVLGPVIEFLAAGGRDTDSYCVFRGTIPTGVEVPVHHHPDDESMFMLSGKVEVLLAGADGSREWATMGPGDFVHIPAGVAHGWRNPFEESALQIIITTPRMGRFFREVGTRVPEGRVTPPAAEDVNRFRETAARYGHYLE